MLQILILRGFIYTERMPTNWAQNMQFSKLLQLLLRLESGWTLVEVHALLKATF